MMEDDLSDREAEVTALRREVATLRNGVELREEEHREEVQGLLSQVDEAHGAAVRDVHGCICDNTQPSAGPGSLCPHV